MALHINKNRDNISEVEHDDLDTSFYGFDINEIYKSTLGSQIINVKPTVMKVDYSASM